MSTSFPDDVFCSTYSIRLILQDKSFIVAISSELDYELYKI